jgi:hypothetical protein
MSSITVSGPGIEDPQAAREAVEQEIYEFNSWFSAPQSSGGLGNAPLIGPELALLRTYLTARLAGRFSPPGDPRTSASEDDSDPQSSSLVVET